MNQNLSTTELADFKREVAIVRYDCSFPPSQESLCPLLCHICVTIQIFHHMTDELTSFLVQFFTPMLYCLWVLVCNLEILKWSQKE